MTQEDALELTEAASDEFVPFAAEQLTYTVVDPDAEEEVEDNGMLNPALTDVSVEEEERELTEEEKFAELEAAVLRQPTHREIHLRVLGACHERQDLPVIESLIAAQPEFSQATLSQYHLIQILAKHHGLEMILLDDDGNVVTEEQLEGLTEDEQDDLVAQEAYLTTEVGRKLYEISTPAKRMAGLFEDEPIREQAFLEILEFCSQQKRTYKEVSDLLEGNDVLNYKSDGTPQKIQPSVLLDRLQRAGALVWEEGWKLTEEGEKFLNQAR